VKVFVNGMLSRQTSIQREMRQVAHVLIERRAALINMQSCPGKDRNFLVHGASKPI
jgi:hypothetical protein